MFDPRLGLLTIATGRGVDLPAVPATSLSTCTFAGAAAAAGSTR